MALTAMPAIRNVLESGNTILSLVAGAVLLPGQAVEAAATGVSGQVVPGTGANAPIGVALYGAGIGDPVAIAAVGCVAVVATEEDIDAGDQVNVLAAAGGTPDGGLVGVASGVEYVLGTALDDIAADSTGRVLIAPSMRGGT